MCRDQIKTDYQAMAHVGSVRQTVRILSIESSQVLRTGDRALVRRVFGVLLAHMLISGDALRSDSSSSNLRSMSRPVRSCCSESEAHHARGLLPLTVVKSQGQDQGAGRHYKGRLSRHRIVQFGVYVTADRTAGRDRKFPV